MYIRELGDGPCVLLLHGTPSPPADWGPVAERLSRRYRVLIPDLPGYGQSAPPLDADVERVDDALAEALHARGAGTLRAVAGFSSGAYRAFDLVLRGRVEAELVVSLAGVAGLDGEAREGRQQIARAIEADPAFLRSDQLRVAMSNLMVSPTWSAAHPADVERVRAWVELTTAAAIVAELDGFIRARDLRPELPTIAARVYLRVGELDLAAPPSVSNEIRRLVPRATLDVVAGCGHALLVEDLGGTIDAIEAQLARRH